MEFLELVKAKEKQMSFGIELSRVGVGGRRIGRRADLRLTACVASKHGRNPSLGFRVSPEAMKRLGWLSGDLVTARCDMADGSKVVAVTMTRTTDENAGCRLSDQGKKDNAGNVRFTLPQSDLDKIFTNCVKGYDGSLKTIDTASGKAVFEVRVG
jgi:hypothetical protein